ncbi:hypothetical protein TcBrA4_0039790 [Trypanosoma cruzi]|nr:hypothetical protein TcBrA4_0039790 [Trypanosoma cruzi]
MSLVAAVQLNNIPLWRVAGALKCSWQAIQLHAVHGLTDLHRNQKVVYSLSSSYLASTNKRQLSHAKLGVQIAPPTLLLQYLSCECLGLTRFWFVFLLMLDRALSRNSCCWAGVA